ncbi:L-seryl-tRNA(Sec) selenium transferase [bacterium]|nr:L-seryl-tRNA(Sec) selenium transferase [bacterium]
MIDAVRKGQNLRLVPSVDKVLNTPEIKEALNHTPRWLILKIVREALDEFRISVSQVRSGCHSQKGIGKKGSSGNLHITSSTTQEDALRMIINRALERNASIQTNSLRRVINGTGVIIHTNLGRAPLSPEAISLINEVAQGYSNLEYDLSEGKRGKRTSHVHGLVLRLTGAEDAFVVNNNAGAVLLALNSLAEGKEVIVSRGELVEIGGSFRIPDVMKKSGAIMREVGTTNRTHISDYENAVSENTGLLLKVHTSNYKITGFSSDVSLKDLVDLGSKCRIPVMMDLGSGNLTDISIFGLKGEPTIHEILSTGVNVVTFSGDKLLGGPQAGIILSQGGIDMSVVRINPLARALRIDKLTLAALEATLRLYQRNDYASSNPVMKMIGISIDDLKSRAQKCLSMFEEVNKGMMILSTREDESSVGGGALPSESLPTFVIVFKRGRISVEELDRAFRGSSPAVVGRIKDGAYILDLRTIMEDDIPLLINLYEKIVEYMGVQ